MQVTQWRPRFDLNIVCQTPQFQRWRWGQGVLSKVLWCASPEHLMFCLENLPFRLTHYKNIVIPYSLTNGPTAMYKKHDPHTSCGGLDSKNLLFLPAMSWLILFTSHPKIQWIGTSWNKKTKLQSQCAPADASTLTQTAAPCSACSKGCRLEMLPINLQKWIFKEKATSTRQHRWTASDQLSNNSIILYAQHCEPGHFLCAYSKN